MGMPVHDDNVVSMKKAAARFSRVPARASRLKLSGEPLWLLMALGLHANRNTGHCYPGLDLLAEESGILRRNLHRNFRILINARLVRINPDGSYTVIYHDQDHPLSPETERLSPETEPLSPETEPLSPETEPYIEEQPIEQPRGTAHSTARVCARENRLIDGVEVLTPHEAKAADQFERLWHAYPSRPDDPKERARAAFNEIVTAGVGGDLVIAAAERYAEWVTLDSAGAAYAPHLHKWLREGRYEHQTKDWPEPRRRPGGNVASAVAAFAMGPLKPSSPEWGNNDNANAEPAVRDRPVSEPWIDRLKHLKDGNKWQAEWGPCWGKPGCRVPGLDTAIGQSYAIWFLRHPEQMKV